MANKSLEMEARIAGLDGDQEPKEHSILTDRMMDLKHRIEDQHPGAARQVSEFIARHPRLARYAAAGSLVSAGLVGQVSAIDINWTEMDSLFDGINQHVIPKTGETVTAMPQIILPLAFLIVLLMIIFFVPQLLGDFLDMIRGAIKGNK